MNRSRPDDALRPVDLQPGAQPFAEGSCLVAMGRTRVLCTASVDEELPAWRRESGLGWVTAEYAMLPRATATRTPRERERMRGRTQEIQRLIGRSLRAVVDFAALGPRTVILDCDVLQADGGTRTAAVTGAWVALARAVEGLRARDLVEGNPVLEPVAAVSVGIVGERSLLDLDYEEDRDASVDLNVAGTSDGRLVEVQGTAEDEPFPRSGLEELLDLAQAGVRELARYQRKALEAGAPPAGQDEPG